jgi:structure-specific endonuclease subunit SLX1
MVNLHLLLRVQSFSRWPLSLRFFASDVFREWQSNDKQANTNIRSTIEVVLDPLAVDISVKRKTALKTNPKAQELAPTKTKDSATTHNAEIANLGQQPVVQIAKTASMIEQLDCSYAATKPHLEKSKALLSIGERNSCSCCTKPIRDDPLVLVCPHIDCSAVSHIQCLSQKFLWREQGATGHKLIVPIEGLCPSCNLTTKWKTLVQELSLRLRGQKEIEQLFKPTRKKKSDGTIESDDELDPAEDDEMSGFLELEEETSGEMEEGIGPAWEMDTASPIAKERNPPKIKIPTEISRRTNDWTDVEVLD